MTQTESLNEFIVIQYEMKAIKEWRRILSILMKKSWWIVVKTSVYKVNSLRAEVTEMNHAK